MLRKKSLVTMFLAAVFFFPSVVGAMNLNHILTLKGDGTGNLNISYWAKKSDIRSSNSMIGNFPFTQDKIQELFTSKGVVVKSITVADDSKDNSYERATFTVFFPNLDALNSLKPFSDFKISSAVTGAGNVITYSISKEFDKMNSIENLFVILKPEAEILSSNGKIEGKSVSWFRGGEFLKGDKAFTFTATLKSEEKTTSGTSSGEEKSCGLFGIELPLILLGALVFARRMK